MHTRTSDVHTYTHTSDVHTYTHTSDVLTYKHTSDVLTWASHITISFHIHVLDLPPQGDPFKDWQKKGGEYLLLENTQQRQSVSLSSSPWLVVIFLALSQRRGWVVWGIYPCVSYCGVELAILSSPMQ